MSYGRENRGSDYVGYPSPTSLPVGVADRLSPYNKGSAPALAGSFIIGRICVFCQFVANTRERPCVALDKRGGGSIMKTRKGAASISGQPRRSKLFLREETATWWASGGFALHCFLL